MRALADLGVGVSLDDFGTGYSSLAQLTRLGISEIKLDPELRRRPARCAERSMRSSPCAASHSARHPLGRRGGGERGDRRCTPLIGCDGAQGWHFSRPLNAIMASEWLAEQQVRGQAPSGGGAYSHGGHVEEAQHAVQR